MSDPVGMAVTNVRVAMRVLATGTAARSLNVMRMYGVDRGMKDLHYGANVDLAPGKYTVRLTVNGHPAMLSALSVS